jgi:hypothetical protein
MDRRICPTCGTEHDLSDMEPSYARPDAYLAVPKTERASRTSGGKDACRVRDAADRTRQYFLRVLLPVAVRGEGHSCCWGVWVEVDEASFARADKLWDDPKQATETPFAATLANKLKGYQGTLGLPGSVQLTGPTSVPSFSLAASVDHPLATEQRDGVYPERVLEWLANHCGE